MSLRSPFSSELVRHCMLSGRTQRHALLRHQSDEMKILNILFSRMGIEHTTCGVDSATATRLANYIYVYNVINIYYIKDILY